MEMSEGFNANSIADSTPLFLRTFYDNVRISMITTVITVVTFIITTMIGVLPIILHYDQLQNSMLISLKIVPLHYYKHYYCNSTNLYYSLLLQFGILYYLY